jgi:gliding motility-associated-like protein
VTWFASETAAETNTFPIPDPTAWTNTVPGFQTVFARLEEINFGCYDVVPLNVQVDDAPALTDPVSPYFICDNDGDGIEVFDLTTKEGEILNTLVNVTLSYHLTQAEAEASVNPITPATAFGSGGQLIWVRGENSAGCFTVVSFELILGQVPTYTEVPEFAQCDIGGDGVELFDLESQNAAIVAGDFTLSVSYHLTQAEAEGALNPLVSPYSSTGEVIWVRVESNVTGCYGVFEMTLTLTDLPEIFEPAPLTYCDEDNDGFGEFNLTDADEDVVNGNPSGNLVVSYHETLADAENGVNPLVSPYGNVDPFTQIVYVRLVDLSTGCYATTTLELQVLDSPQLGDPEALILCDDDGDGFGVFDLTLAEPQILNGLDPLQYTVSYYEDAALTVAVTNATSYTNITNPQTLFVVVVDTLNGCTGETTLELQVNLPPVLVAPTPLELCDVNNPGDEMEAFDLESKTAEITGGDPDILITYHESQGDADAGINALSSPYINMVPQPQTIYIRAEGASSGCVVSSGVTLDLVVNPLPSPQVPTPLEVCDGDNDGFALFDLESKTVEIAGGELVSITYHETLLDAELGLFALSSPYQNIIGFSQTVYARAEYALGNPAPFNTGCFRVVELELLALPTPVVPLTLDPLVICDPEGDGVEVFDLTVQSAQIYGIQDPSLFSLTYHESQGAAQAGLPQIADPANYTNTSNPQTVWFRLTSNDNACFAIGSFELQAPQGPALTQPEPFSVCDDVGEVNDGITVFDLTTKDAEITSGAIGVAVRYYETAADAQGDTNAIDPATAYQNISNPQTLFIRVIDGNTGCFDASLTLTLRVVSNPEAGTPDALRQCDVNDPGDGVEVFDLTQAEAAILQGQPFDVSYHESYQEAFDNTNAIADPQNYSNTSSPQTIYVRVTNSGIPEGCFEIVELVLIVDPLPDTTAPVSDYILCAVGGSGQGVFDLTTKEEEILGGQDPALFTVSFYQTPGDAAAGINPIVNTSAYPNVTNPQRIYVGITSGDTGCYNSGQEFDLEVREGAEATAPVEPYTICDNLDANDGIGEFVLDGSTAESQAVIDTILGGQDPVIYSVSFHQSQGDADAGINALGSPFVNTVNPQLIYARVTNGDTDCSATAEVLLKVEQLPQISLQESYRLCVDANGNPIPEEFGLPSPPVIDTGLSGDLYSFEWFLNGELLLGQDEPFLEALSGGEYVVVVTELLTGCSSEAATTVTVSSPPTDWNVEVITSAFSSDPAIEVTADGQGDYLFQLDDGLPQADGLFEGVSPGLHLVTIFDQNGCGSVTQEVSIIDYPRFVTPNQDGYHDTWNIIGIAGGDPTAKIYIFDRFGKLLKQLSPLGEGWDGTYNGAPLPSSDYWFLVEYTEDDERKEFKGHFTLKR